MNSLEARPPPFCPVNNLLSGTGAAYPENSEDKSDSDNCQNPDTAGEKNLTGRKNTSKSQLQLFVFALIRQVMILCKICKSDDKLNETQIAFMTNLSMKVIEDIKQPKKYVLCFKELGTVSMNVFKDLGRLFSYKNLHEMCEDHFIEPMFNEVLKVHINLYLEGYESFRTSPYKTSWFRSFNRKLPKSTVPKNHLQY